MIGAFVIIETRQKHLCLMRTTIIMCKTLKMLRNPKWIIMITILTISLIGVIRWADQRISEHVDSHLGSIERISANLASQGVGHIRSDSIGDIRRSIESLSKGITIPPGKPNSGEVYLFRTDPDTREFLIRRLDVVTDMRASRLVRK